MHDGTLTNASGLTPSPPPERTKATCVAAHYNVRLLGPAFGQVSVEQTFENITPPAAVASSSTAAAAAAVPEAIFTFPVSSGARVTGMQAQFGGKTITAVLKETGAARATYEEAKSSGKATALLEADAERPDMFQMCIGAVLPGVLLLPPLCCSLLSALYMHGLHLQDTPSK